MSFKRQQSVGINFVPAYEVSGVPFVTSSVANEVAKDSSVRVSFPSITRWVEVVNTGDEALKVGFTKNGVLGKGASVSGSTHEQTANHRNYYVIGPSGSRNNSTARWELRCHEIHFSSISGATSFSVVAGLTGIQNSQLSLTGSQGFIGVG
jgi:hypothetical protein